MSGCWWLIGGVDFWVGRLGVGCVLCDDGCRDWIVNDVNFSEFRRAPGNCRCDGVYVGLIAFGSSVLWLVGSNFWWVVKCACRYSTVVVAILRVHFVEYGRESSR